MSSEEKIRALCTQLLAAQDEEEIGEIAVQLKAALHEHCETVRQLARTSFPLQHKTHDL